MSFETGAFDTHADLMICSEAFGVFKQAIGWVSGRERSLG